MYWSDSPDSGDFNLDGDSCIASGSCCAFICEDVFDYDNDGGDYQI
jgi:ferredoxin